MNNANVVVNGLDVHLNLQQQYAYQSEHHIVMHLETVNGLKIGTQINLVLNSDETLLRKFFHVRKALNKLNLYIYSLLCIVTCLEQIQKKEVVMAVGYTNKSKIDVVWMRLDGEVENNFSMNDDSNRVQCDIKCIKVTAQNDTSTLNAVDFQPKVDIDMKENVRLSIQSVKHKIHNRRTGGTSTITIGSTGYYNDIDSDEDSDDVSSSSDVDVGKDGNTGDAGMKRPDQIVHSRKKRTHTSAANLASITQQKRSKHSHDMDIEENSEELQELKDERDQLQLELTSKNKELTQSQKNYTKLERKLEKEKHQMVTANQKLATAQQKLVNMKRTLQSTQNDFNQIQTQLNELKQQNEILTMKVNNKTDESNMKDTFDWKNAFVQAMAAKDSQFARQQEQITQLRQEKQQVQHQFQLTLQQQLHTSLYMQRSMGGMHAMNSIANVMGSGGQPYVLANQNQSPYLNQMQRTNMTQPFGHGVPTQFTANNHSNSGHQLPIGSTATLQEAMARAQQK